MKRCLTFFVLPLVALFFVVSTGSAAQNKAKPNVIYIMSDDHASAAISAYGSWLKGVAKTPNLDKLCRQGMRFTNCVVTNSICTPSRAVMLTGQYSHKNGVLTLSDRMDPGRRHLGHMMQEAGYQTAMIGKWHLKTIPQGFDYYNILPGQGQYRDPVLFTGSNTRKNRKQYKGKYSTDVITSLSLDWIKNRDTTKPFFLCCHFKAPHRPWDPAKRYADLYKGQKIPEHPTLYDTYNDLFTSAANAKMKIGQDFNTRDLEQPIPTNMTRNELRKWAYQRYMKRYLGVIAAVDENVGRLMDYLDKAGLADNTIIIYTSDQGFFIGEHGWYDKRFMYEPCLTTPLIVRYPGHVPAGKVNDKIVMNVDFAPTILDYAGKKTPKSMDGRSLKPLLEGKTPNDWRTSMYYRYYMHLAHHWVPAHLGVRNERYTLIYYYSRDLGAAGSVKNTPTPQGWELFDRKKDPNQTKNYYDHPDYQSIIREMKGDLVRLRRQVADTDPVPGLKLRTKED